MTGGASLGGRDLTSRGGAGTWPAGPLSDRRPVSRPAERGPPPPINISGQAARPFHVGGVARSPDSGGRRPRRRPLSAPLFELVIGRRGVSAGVGRALSAAGGARAQLHGAAGPHSRAARAHQTAGPPRRHRPTDAGGGAETAQPQLTRMASGYTQHPTPEQRNDGTEERATEERRNGGAGSKRPSSAAPSTDKPPRQTKENHSLLMDIIIKIPCYRHIFCMPFRRTILVVGLFYIRSTRANEHETARPDGLPGLNADGRPTPRSPDYPTTLGKNECGCTLQNNWQTG